MMKTYEALAWSSVGIFDEGFRFEFEASNLAEAQQKYAEIASSQEWAWRKLFLQQIGTVEERNARVEAYMSQLH